MLLRASSWAVQVFYHEHLLLFPLVSSFSCQALLFFYTTNQSLGEAAVSSRMSSSEGLLGSGLQIQSGSIEVQMIGEVQRKPTTHGERFMLCGNMNFFSSCGTENCPGENPLHYRWPETRPTITQNLPCFPNKDQSTTRTW